MEHVRAVDLEQAGVTFKHVAGKLTVNASSPELSAKVMAERDRRGRLMLAQMPPTGPVELIRICDREPARWGECMTCAEPIKPHHGGMCPLCIGGLKWALKERGR